MKNIIRAAFFVINLTSMTVTVCAEDAQPTNQEVVNQTQELYRSLSLGPLKELRDKYLQNNVLTRDILNPAVQYFYNSFTCPSLKILTDAELEPCIADLLSWKKAAPKTSIPYVVSASYYLTAAVQARGISTINNVPSEARQRYESLLEKAMNELVLSQNLTDRDPQWYTTGMEISFNVGDLGKAQQLFYEGQSKYPTYYPLYRSFANFIQPQWYGQKGQVEQFLTTFGDKIGGEEGDILYTKAAENIAFNFQAKLYSYYAISWPRLKKGYEALQKRAPRSKPLIARFAAQSAFANDQETARDLFLKLGDVYDDDVARGFDNEASFKSYRTWALTPANNIHSALSSALLEKDPEKITAALANGADVNQKLPDQTSPICSAIQLREPQLVSLLLSYHPRLEPENASDCWPLFSAIVQGQLEIIKMLVKHGADVNFSSNKLSTPLVHAADRNLLPIVQYLLTVPKIDINKGDSNGLTPLIAAIIKENSQVAELLLGDKRIDVNAPNKAGFPNALHTALNHENTRVAIKLIAQGADLSFKDRLGNTPLQVAEAFQLGEVVALIKRKTS